MPKGIWIYSERLDNWHLKVSEETTGEEPEVTLLRKTWCGLEFLGLQAPEKEGTRLSEWGDTVHDDCWRKSEELLP